MKKYILILFLVLNYSLSAQKLTINPKIKVDSTELKIKSQNNDLIAYTSFDNKKQDSLIVSFGTIGLTAIVVKIDLTDSPKPYITLWSDSNVFDGKHSMDIQLEFYDLTLNKTEFEIGDRIMGIIKGKSKTITNQIGKYQISFEGKFSHIIGKIMRKKKAEDNYHIRDGK